MGALLRYLLPFVLATTIVLLSPLPTPADEPDSVDNMADAGAEALLARARLYWSYKAAGDLDKAYSLEDPQVRETLKLKDYLVHFGTDVKWLEAKIGAADTTTTPATVEVTLRYVVLVSRYNPKEGRKMVVKDKWVKAGDGQWYHSLPRRTLHAKPEKPGRRTDRPSESSAATASPPTTE